jgi:hypothetical protein
MTTLPTASLARQHHRVPLSNPEVLPHRVGRNRSLSLPAHRWRPLDMGPFLSSGFRAGHIVFTISTALLPASLGRLKECSNPPDPRPRAIAHCHRLARPKSGLVVAIPLARRPARAFGPTVHAAPFSSADCCLSARATTARPGAAAERSGHVRQSPLNICLTHGVVCHFCSPPSRCPALTIPTIPWAPEWI